MDQALIEFAARIVIFGTFLPLVMIVSLLGITVFIMVAVKVEELLSRFSRR